MAGLVMVLRESKQGGKWFASPQPSGEISCSFHLHYRHIRDIFQRQPRLLQWRSAPPTQALQIC
jgi:hypothetical protein